jgi:hypothetical protein
LSKSSVTHSLSHFLHLVTSMSGIVVVGYEYILAQRSA